MTAKIAEMRDDYMKGPAWRRTALEEAVTLMDGGCEPTSALKQAGADHGVAYGEDMEKFVEWARDILQA